MTYNEIVFPCFLSFFITHAAGGVLGRFRAILVIFSFTMYCGKENDAVETR